MGGGSSRLLSGEADEQGNQNHDAWHLWGEEDDDDDEWSDVSAETVSEYFRTHPGEAEKENDLGEYNKGGFGFLRKRSNSTKDE